MDVRLPYAANLNCPHWSQAPALIWMDVSFHRTSPIPIRLSYRLQAVEHHMLGAYGLAQNVSNFLAGGAPSGNQGFGAVGFLASGLNPTAQFVGSYGWSMALSGGNLNIALTNTTTAWSFFYHAPGLNPNPATRFDSVFNPGRHYMGRVNQAFQIQVPCS